MGKLSPGWILCQCPATCAQCPPVHFFHRKPALRPIPVDWVEQVWAKYLRPIKRNLFLTNLPKVFEFVSHHDALNLPKISPFATSLLTPLSSDQFSAVKLISSHCCPTSSPSVIFTSIASLDKPKRFVDYLAFQTLNFFLVLPLQFCLFCNLFPG